MKLGLAHRLTRAARARERGTCMDFAIAYTEEQQRFRQEVQAWIEENVPENMRDPIDNRDLTEEQWRFWRGIPRHHHPLCKHGLKAKRFGGERLATA